MTTARLLTTFTLDSTNNQLVVTYDTGGAPSTTIYTIPAGTYRWSLDNSASDFGKELEDQLEAGDFTVFQALVYGVDVTTAGIAEGRISFRTTDSVEYRLDFADANTTIDPRIFGFGASPGNQSSTSGILLSPFAHRYGWYPQIDATEDLIQQFRRRVAEYATTLQVDSVDWGEYQETNIGFTMRSSALVRVAASENSAVAGAVDTTVDDVNIAFERWALDAGDSDESWYYYPDASSTGTAKGPYRFPENSVLWTTPLRPPTRINPTAGRAGEYWDVVVRGVTAVG